MTRTKRSPEIAGMAGETYTTLAGTEFPVQRNGVPLGGLHCSNPECNAPTPFPLEFGGKPFCSHYCAFVTLGPVRGVSKETADSEASKIKLRNSLTELKQQAAKEGIPWK